jgi:hypothetical protein
MADQRGTVAKKLASGQIEYTCPVCGGWDRLCEVYYSFLPLVDHLVQDLCIMQHPMLSEPKTVEGELWFRVPGTSKLIPGLPRYSPDSPEWRELLGRNKKILPQAEIFLVDIGNWLEMALSSIAGLNTIQKSDLTTAEALVFLIGSLGAEFGEQKTIFCSTNKTWWTREPIRNG